MLLVDDPLLLPETGIYRKILKNIKKVFIKVGRGVELIAGKNFEI